MAGLEVGLSAELEHAVTPPESAANWGGDLPVLSTAVLLWLAELVAVRAIEGRLREGEMTLGLAHDAEHLAPTPVGEIVTVGASLEEVNGSRLAFRIWARDGADDVLRGVHTRALVDRSRFVERLRSKQERLAGELRKG